MALLISDVLDKGRLAAVREKADALSWRDGARTAGAAAQAVKRNEQADLSTKAGQSMARFLIDAITAHPVFQAAARPAWISPLILSRTAAGGGYGRHVDNAYMAGGEGRRLRTDLSFTLFLSDPDAYSGGALIIETADGEESIRPPAGTLALYPSGAVHQVATVADGVRLAGVGWVQSRIRRADQRGLLFDLDMLRARLAAHDAAADDRLLLDQAISNLLRMWGD